ncbi:GerMN domain-containing protein [Niallia sp. Krafla_26]|uniref:GerMN domain-containing protein n=1 Tax=Niallia sp. Krafla_26 TaxID=3064703 RepID=UPI003D181724
MKKYVGTCLAVLVLLLSGCLLERGNNANVESSNRVQEDHKQQEQDQSNKDKLKEAEKEPNTETEIATIEEYYPLKENVRYVYEGQGNEYASYVVHIDYISDQKVQQRIDNGGTVIARIVEIKDGKLVETYSREEAYYRENLLNTGSGDEEVLLMEPLKEETTWKLNDSSVRTITNLSAEVSTPAGDYEAIEVSTEGPHGKTLDYYVKGIGLVHSVFHSKGTEVSSSLSKIEEDVPFIQTVSFFFPNINDDQMYYRNREVSFQTNDITRIMLEKAYKENVPDKLSSVLTKNMKINSLYLNQDNNLYIDLNQAFLTELVAGSGVEAMILQSVVNTFGHYYGVEKVLLSIDNKPYSSGHISMNKGEFFTVTSIDGAIKLQ